MLKPMSKISLLLVAVLSLSCGKSKESPSAGTVETEKPTTEPSEPALKPGDATVFKVVLKIKGTPSNIRFSELKYDKQGVFSMDWDDGSVTSLESAKLFEELKYSDGTGKMIPWRAGIAVIGQSSYNDQEVGNWQGQSNVTYEEMKTLLSKGWDLENHGLYSGIGGGYTKANALEDLEEMHKLILERQGYKMAVTVVPSAENGYVEASKRMGYLAATAQRGDLGGDLEAYPGAEWMALTQINTWPPGFKYLTRLFTDHWEEADWVQEKMEELLDTSNKSAKKLLRVGTHNSSSPAFNTLMSSLSTKMAGKFWVCSMRELMEYEKVKEEAELKVEEGTVTIRMPPDLRWEDFTLIIEGAEVESATCQQADAITFSGSMVNVYKDRYKEF